MDGLASVPFSVERMMQECSIEQDLLVDVLRIGVMIATQMLTSLTCSPGGIMTGACCSDLCSVLLVFWVIDAAFRLVQRRAWISPGGHHVSIC